MRSRVIQAALLLAATTLSPAAGMAKPASAPAKGQIRIDRDTYGVPHIYAASEPALYYGLGHAIAQDRLFQLEMMRRSVWGEVAEVLGASFVDFDRETRRRSYTRAEVVARLARLSPGQRALFQAYAAGINAFINQAEQTGKLPEAFAANGFAPKPWTAEDLAQIFIGNVAVRFTDRTQELENAQLRDSLMAQFGAQRGAALFDDMVPLDEDPGAFTSIAAGDWQGKSLRALSVVGDPRGGTVQARASASAPGNFADAAGALARVDHMLGASMQRLALNDHGGSNVWLVGKDKSASGAPMLMGGPQMGFTRPGFLYEAGLHGAGVDIVGSTPIGFIPIFFGHNGTAAWSSTVGKGDAVDTFVEHLDPQDPTRYFYKGEWRAMALRHETIRVKGGTSIEATFARTVHGPVLQVDEARHLAYSRARAWEGHELETEMAWAASTHAKTFAAFRAAALHSAISINWWYADKAGNIGWIYPGRFPLRQPDQDPRLPSDGTGASDWRGFLDPAQQPWRLNPSRGYFTNWNQQPVKGWYFPDTGWGSVERVKLLQDFMDSHAHVSAADMEGLNHLASTTSQTAGLFLPGLLAAIDQAGSNKADSGGERLAQARDLLAAWDHHRTDADGDGRYDSAGMTIFEAWLSAMTARVFAPAVVGAKASAMLAYKRQDTYDIGRGPKLLGRVLAGAKASLPVEADYLGGKSAAQVSVEVLNSVLAQLVAERGPAMESWLDPVLESRFTVANAHAVPQGSQETITVPLAERGTENHLVELRADGAVGRNVVAPGQAESGDRHQTDQIGLFRDYRYKPMLFTPAQVAAASTGVELLADPYARRR